MRAETSWRDQVELGRQLLWRRKWYVLIPWSVVGVISIPVVLNLPSLYQATTLIMVEPQKVPEEFVRATVTVPIQDRLKTISQQVLSRTRLERVIDEFSLFQGSTVAETPQWRATVKKWTGHVRSWIGFTPPDPVEGEPDKLSLVERMRNNIAITVTGGSTFSITYTGEDPRVVQAVTNKLASLFIDENLKVREAQAEGTAEFLESELGRVKAKLEAQESELRGFKQRYMGELPSQLDANLRTLDRLQAEKISLEEQLRSAEERYALINQFDLFEFDTPAGAGATRPEESKLLALKRRLTELRRTYKDDYPDVVSLKKEIARLEEETEAQGLEEPKHAVPQEPSVRRPPLQDAAALTLTLAPLKQRLEEVGKEIRRYQERVDNTFLREQQLGIILRDYETISKTYQGLLDKRQNARIAENLERRQKGEIFRVLDPAELPERPFKPNRFRLITLGWLLGLGVGIGLAVVREQLDPSIKTERDLVEATTGIPILSVIPFVVTVQSHRRSKPKAILPPPSKARSES